MSKELPEKLETLSREMRAVADYVEQRARALDTQDGWRQSHRWFRKADELREGALNVEGWAREILRERGAQHEQ